MIGKLNPDAKLGEVTSEPEALYRSSGAISQSSLTDFLRNQAYFHRKHVLRNFTEGTTSPMKMGTALHCLVLEPDEYAKRYQAQPAKMRKGTKAYEAWSTDLGDRDALTPSEDSKVHGMREAILENPEAADLLNAEGKNELILRMFHLTTGLPIQGRLDAWRPKFNSIIDIKGTENLEKWARAVVERHLHIQDYWYSMLTEMVLMVDNPWFTFIVCEWDPPHRVGLFRLSSEWRKRGEREAEPAMVELKHCLETNTWQRDEPGVKVIELPKWAKESA